jgi:large exoprotein involved in heme utilization and adhesion
VLSLSIKGAQTHTSRFYSAGDQLFQGTQAYYGSLDIRAGVGEKARSDARIILEGVKAEVFQQRTRESNYVVWQKKIDEGSYSQTLAMPRFSGPGGLSVQIPEGDFTSQIASLSAQPGMGYLNDLVARKDVNWQPVKLAHEQWSYKQEGLTSAGAALLAKPQSLQCSRRVLWMLFKKLHQAIHGVIPLQRGYNLGLTGNTCQPNTLYLLAGNFRMD